MLHTPFPLLSVLASPFTVYFKFSLVVFFSTQKTLSISPSSFQEPFNAKAPRMILADSGLVIASSGGSVSTVAPKPTSQEVNEKMNKLRIQAVLTSLFSYFSLLTSLSPLSSFYIILCRTELYTITKNCILCSVSVTGTAFG